MRRPHFIAKQARNASGPLGQLIAFIMFRETWRENQHAIEALDVAAGDHVLDIGCGPGRSLGALSAKAPHGGVLGADSSELMVEIATGQNRALIRSGRVKVVVASADALPVADNSFDKVLCVHVIYFWDDFRASFREIARVLKPGGRLALVFRSTLHQTAVKSFPSDIYHFRDVAEVREALLAEGFSVEEKLGSGVAARTPPPHFVLARRGD